MKFKVAVVLPLQLTVHLLVDELYEPYETTRCIDGNLYIFSEGYLREKNDRLGFVNFNQSVKAGGILG